VKGYETMNPASITPHIGCSPEDFAKTVLMPGDPLRAKLIAENYLTDAELVNNIRGIQGYTGYYQGKRISVMASGMGMPSIGIYSYELYNMFHVESIIRIGSAGAIHPDLQLYDIVIAQGACTDSNYFQNFKIRGSYAPIADFELLSKAVETCKNRGLRYKVGNILSSDVFYNEGGVQETLQWRKFGVLAVEMEAAALYMNAARAGKKALAICTISDLMENGAVTTAAERQNAFNAMMEVALTIAE
jgi:purine-nucleoside phosphorylase